MNLDALLEKVQVPHPSLVRPLLVPHWGAGRDVAWFEAMCGVISGELVQQRVQLDRLAERRLAVGVYRDALVLRRGIQELDEVLAFIKRV